MKIKLSDISEGKLEKAQSEALQNYFKQGGTWQHLLELTEGEVEQLYAKGHGFYASGDFPQALTTFAALVQLNPYQAKHWIAMGAACQAQEEYSQAEYAYEIALILDADNIKTLFYAAQVCYAQEKNEQAISYLKQIVAMQTENEEEKGIIERASYILGLCGEPK